MNQHSRQRGQVLILIILAIAAIFGFAALSVDVGRAYSERRRAQSSADAAAYAAAFARAEGKGRSYQEAARYSLRLNGYDDADLGPNPAADMDVQVYNPPISGKYSVNTETIRRNEYFQVFIRQKVDPVFSQFVYDGPMEVMVEAIARGTSSMSFAGGASIVATCSDCCNAIWFHGTADITVTDGNIISNSTQSDEKECEAGFRAGTSCVEMNNGKMFLAGTLFENGNSCGITGNSTPLVVEKSPDLWGQSDYGAPSCAGMTTFTKSEYKVVGKGGAGEKITLSPGIYPNGIKITGEKTVVTMEPGMYCLGQDLEVTSGTLNGDKVMFVMLNNSSIKINTSQTVSLTAPSDDGDGVIEEFECIPDDSIYNGYCWSGFLVYMPVTNTGTVFFAGGNTTNYTGTVYAPGPYTSTEAEAKCTILGNADNMGVNASVICYTVKVGGTGNIDIHYFDDANAQSPASVELTK